jgi:hypothetical protein
VALEFFGASALQITVTPNEHSERLADWIVYVDTPEPTSAEEGWSAERRFYRAVRERMPDEVVASAQIVLRFVASKNAF